MDKLFVDARYITPPYPEYITLHAFKATQGNDMVNSILAKQVEGAEDYWFFHYWLYAADSKLQAKNLVDRAKAYGPLEIVLDVEDPAAVTLGATPGKVRATLQEIERLWGRKPILYTRASYWNYKVGNVVWVNEYPLWIAHYGAKTPRLPNGFTGQYKAWQFQGDVKNWPGYNAGIDLNVLRS